MFFQTITFRQDFQLQPELSLELKNVVVSYNSVPLRIPQTKFEAIPPKYVKGDTFLAVADRLQEVLSLSL